MSQNRRAHERKPFINYILYCLLDPQSGKALHDQLAFTIDISEGGMGIRTTDSLEKGTLVQLKSRNKNDRGIVRWVVPEKETGLYRAGIQII